MNSELEQALVGFVNQVTTLLEAGSAQLPAVLHDIVGAALLSATVWWWVGIGVVCLGVLFVVLDFLVDMDGGACALGLVLILIGGIATAANWYNYIYATRFPRLVILDYIRELL